MEKNLPDGLLSHQRESIDATRAKLLEALKRLKDGFPQRVKPGTPVSATSVTKEAKVSYPTIYGPHYADILEEVRRIRGGKAEKSPEEKRKEPPKSRRTEKELRKIIEEYRKDKENLARICHRQEFEIKNLQRRLASLEGRKGGGASVGRGSGTNVVPLDAKRKTSSTDAVSPANR